MEGNLTVAVDVGASFVRVALVRDGVLGPIVGRGIRELERAPELGIVPAIVELMRQSIRSGGGHPAPARVVAAGIGICAAVDDDGALQRPLDFGVPAGRRLRDEVEHALRVPVAVDNDANMAALGELHYGAGEGLTNFLMVTLGSNIGMGIVLGGRVYRGQFGGAGEAGMILVPVRAIGTPADTTGRIGVQSDPFGKGRSRAPRHYAWIEDLVGGAALASALAEARGGDAHAGNDLRVLEAASTGDGDALRVVERAIEGWAYLFASCIALFDPAAIILAGGITDDLAPFLERLRTRASELSRAQPPIRIARLGSTGGLIGASVAARDFASTSSRSGGTSEVAASWNDKLGSPGSEAAQATSDRSILEVEPDEMATEIALGPDAVAATLTALGHAEAVRAEVGAARHVLFLGTGASLAMARCGEALWHEAVTGGTAHRSTTVLEASEFLFGRRGTTASPDTVVIAVSKSGSSPELLAAVEVARAAGARIVSVTAVDSSALASASHRVVVTPIGEEYGAATVSELAALAAILALGNVLGVDPPSVERVRAMLARLISDDVAAERAGHDVGTARRTWTVGYGSSYGVAEALALLLHEKAQLAAVAGTPSGFRHGQIEAAARNDALVVVACDEQDALLSKYLDRLVDDGSRVGLRMVWLAPAARAGEHIALTSAATAERALEALVRAQQIAHAAAHAAGTYTDGFKVLRTLVSPGESFM